MHPILLRWPPVTSYGAMMLVGLLAGWVLARRQAKRAGLDPSHIDLMAPLLIIGGLVGGLGLSAAAEPASLGVPAGHGRVLYGSLLASVGTGIVYALIARIPLGKLGDVFAAPIAFGIAAGRTGCFLAGCCWGDVCGDFPLGVAFPRGSYAYDQHVATGVLDLDAASSLRVHPTQLYEAAGAAIIGGVLLGLWRYRRVSGELFLAMGLAYAALRFGVEILRADNAAVGLGMTLSQWVCVGTAGTCAVTCGVRRAAAGGWGLKV